MSTGRVRGYRRIRELIVDQRTRRFVASLDQADYVIPDEVKERLRGKLKSILDENILPFRFPHCLDFKSGGYLAECSLNDHLWDDDHGGFFWEIDFEYKRPTKPNKHLCGQAFALYALSEFVLATGDSDARSMADRLFELLDRHAHDARHGGYVEYLARDWTPVRSNEPHYMGHPPDIKQVNTHVHLMEALTSYARLADSELV